MNTLRFNSSSGDSAPGAGAALVAASPATDPGTPAVQPVTAFSGGAAFAADDALPGKPRMSSTSALLMGGVLVAGAALVGMRHLGIGPGAAMGKVQFDTRIVDRAPLALGDHSALLADLSASRVQLQVPDDSVKQNPFMLAHVLPEAGAAPPDDAQALAAVRAEAERQTRSAAERKRALVDALKGLTLNSVIEGATPVARISGKAVRVGDSVADLFTVHAIRGRTVELAHESTIYLLELNKGGYSTAEPVSPATLPPSNTLRPFDQ